MLSLQGFINGDIAALVLAGLFTLTCLVQAWMEHRDGLKELRESNGEDSRFDERAEGPGPGGHLRPEKLMVATK
ncbi:hypothetical protein AB0O34_31100 [Sphaerisporangium sp. NPDC088356]|uniref:hypothetical protein n=1 Tax=Sphaerisporangium sp. NPDC088356 TaxID=3154871 RepID=UPI003429B762